MTAAEQSHEATTQERYRPLVDSVTDHALFLLDTAGLVTGWTPGAERATGYAERDILGRHFSLLLTEDDRAAGRPEAALRIAATEGRYEAEGWRVRSDGTRFWAHVDIAPLRNAGGGLIGFAHITRDLTRRRRTQEVLRRSEEQFRLLIQSVTDYAIYMLDETGRITNWNVGAERIKGYAPQDIIGENFARFYTEEDRAAGLPQLGLATAARDGRHETEGWRVRSDGTRFWAHAIIDSIRDDDGRLLGFAKITRDITERREAQLALEQAREAFFQAQKMEAIGKLTGGVAHDFNNLLAAVLGSLDLARKRLPPDSDALRFINNAIMAAERGATLTQRMLAFARRQSLKLVPVDVVALVQNMAELLERTLGGQVWVETCFPPVLSPVRADPVQLELAILNLAVNARDAMPDGGRIAVSAREAEAPEDGAGGLAPGRYVCLAVTDEGEGMDERTLAQAIDPFFTTKGLGKGTGLGLPMVHGLAEQCGGRLVLKSRKGEGTTAELWLPVAADAALPPAEPDAEDVPAAWLPVPHGPLTVLAVDDDRLVLNYTVALLQELGHRVLEAASGREALEILKRQPVDLVITDDMMPEMTGTQLAEAVEAGWPGLPVLLITGYAGAGPQKRGDLPRLHKPFQQTQLATAIARLVERGPQPSRELQGVGR